VTDLPGQQGDWIILVIEEDEDIVHLHGGAPVVLKLMGDENVVIQSV